MKSNTSSFFSTAKYDIPASIVVFLVALPLCLGIALASGAPLLSGLIAGIVGGIVIGSLTGSQLSVSGPAAGLVVIVLNAVETLGSYEAFLVAVVLAGAIQLLLGYAKAGIVGMYFPSAVIKGMLAAIGLILILKQIPHMIGFDSDAFGEMEFIQKDGSNTISALGNSFEHIYLGSLLIGLFSLIFLMIWERPFIKNNQFLRQVPGGVVVVVASVLINQLFLSLYPDLAIYREHLVEIPVISNFEELKTATVFPDWSILTSFQLYFTAGTLAIVASLETLLSIEAIDKLDPQKRRSPQNTELKAQGVGNMISGFLGGLPITAVIVRGSANVEAGAKSRVSAIVHGILLVAAVTLFPRIVNMIPLASLAAILVTVGYKLTKPALYKYYYMKGRSQFIPFVTTVVAILFTDLLIGILIGMSVGVFFILRANYRVPYHYEENGDNTITIRLSEHVSFLNKANLQLTLESLPENSFVTLDGSHSKDIDPDALEVIHNFKSVARDKNIELTLEGIPLVKEVRAS